MLTWKVQIAFETIKPALVDELWKAAQRELATGFYYQTPSENEQLFGARRKIHNINLSVKSSLLMRKT